MKPNKANRWAKYHERPSERFWKSNRLSNYAVNRAAPYPYRVAPRRSKP